MRARPSGQGKLEFVPSDVSDFESAMTFREELLERHPRIDMVVACIGSWYYGYSLHRMPMEAWNSIICDNLTSHFVFMRAML